MMKIILASSLLFFLACTKETKNPSQEGSQLAQIDVGKPATDPDSGVQIPAWSTGKLIIRQGQAEVVNMELQDPNNDTTDAEATVPYGVYEIYLSYHDDSGNTVMESCKGQELHRIFSPTYAVGSDVCTPTSRVPIAKVGGEANVMVDVQVKSQVSVILLTDTTFFIRSETDSIKALLTEQGYNIVGINTLKQNPYSDDEPSEETKAVVREKMSQAQVMVLPRMYSSDVAELMELDYFKDELKKFTDGGGQIIHVAPQTLGVVINGVYGLDSAIFATGSMHGSAKRYSALAAETGNAFWNTIPESLDAEGNSSYYGGFTMEHQDASMYIKPIYEVESASSYISSEINVPSAIINIPKPANTDGAFFVLPEKQIYSAGNHQQIDNLLNKILAGDSK